MGFFFSFLLLLLNNIRCSYYYMPALVCVFFNFCFVPSRIYCTIHTQTHTQKGEEKKKLICIFCINSYKFVVAVFRRKNKNGFFPLLCCSWSLFPFLFGVAFFLFSFARCSPHTYRLHCAFRVRTEDRKKQQKNWCKYSV